jgi:hypothetical protein
MRFLLTQRSFRLGERQNKTDEETKKQSEKNSSRVIHVKKSTVGNRALLNYGSDGSPTTRRVIEAK